MKFSGLLPLDGEEALIGPEGVELILTSATSVRINQAPCIFFWKVFRCFCCASSMRSR